VESLNPILAVGLLPATFGSGIALGALLASVYTMLGLPPLKPSGPVAAVASAAAFAAMASSAAVASSGAVFTVASSTAMASSAAFISAATPATAASLALTVDPLPPNSVDIIDAATLGCAIAVLGLAAPIAGACELWTHHYESASSSSTQG
jgi:hypothetical protein